ncbi:unnamed protein product [Caenorhabditis angaria]|uniref:Uncharacterized protein n=1 Tax=Caenorhabditis angaria TaxID=860376 RepID=A0A9P1N1G4_9PELO|nr:unnamed protein product [Caenorhabditis angaria]
METKPKSFWLHSICAAFQHCLVSAAIYYLFHKRALEHIKEFSIAKMKSDLTHAQFARDLKEFSDVSWLAVISNLSLGFFCLMHANIPGKLVAFFVVLFGIFQNICLHLLLKTCQLQFTQVSVARTLQSSSTCLIDASPFLEQSKHLIIFLIFVQFASIYTCAMFAFIWSNKPKKKPIFGMKDCEKIENVE